MPSDAPDIHLERELEKLRQERETFDQNKKHDEYWFFVKITMVGCSIFIMVFILGVVSFILFNPKSFSETTVTIATVGLIGDIIASCASIWTLAMNPDSISKLKPITSENPQISEQE